MKKSIEWRQDLEKQNDFIRTEYVKSCKWVGSVKAITKTLCLCEVLSRRKCKVHEGLCETTSNSFVKLLGGNFDSLEIYVNTDVSSKTSKESRSELNTDTNGDTNLDLRGLRKNDLNKIIVAHLNINSISNKFELLAQQVKDEDIPMICQTKLDKGFPFSQFLLGGFMTPVRFDEIHLRTLNSKKYKEKTTQLL